MMQVRFIPSELRSVQGNREKYIKGMAMNGVLGN